MATQATITRPRRAASLTANRSMLSSIMKLAWGFYRDDADNRSFGACLKAAWTWMRKLKASPLAKAMRKGGSITLADTMKSPVRRHYGARAFVGDRQSHAYQASKMGR